MKSINAIALIVSTQPSNSDNNSIVRTNPTIKDIITLEPFGLKFMF